MVDNEYSIDIYKSSKKRFGTAMRNPEMLNLFLIILKLKKFLSMQLKVPDQQMCDKAIFKNAGILTSVPNCYKNQHLCDKAVDNYPHALEFVPECCKSQIQYNLFLNAIRLKHFL